MVTGRILKEQKADNTVEEAEGRGGKGRKPPPPPPLLLQTIVKFL